MIEPEIDWENGKVLNPEPIVIEFNSYLKLLGISSIFFIYGETNFMSIWVSSIKEVTLAKNIININKEEIINNFKILLEKHKHPNDIEKYSFFSFEVYSFEVSCINHLCRRCKRLVIDKISTSAVKKPENIFCHSEDEQTYKRMPGYYLLYPNIRDVSQSDLNTIKQVCNSVLTENDMTDYYNFDLLDISLVDGKESYYGLSRED